ncbi:MAG: PPC domain-containing DNA-binding protein [Flavisolibacter sp.]
MEEKINIHAIRMKPGEDLKLSLQNFVLSSKIEAGWIFSCIGSLTKYHLRFANQPQGNSSEGFFEIISLSGSLSMHGSHLHMAIADMQGNLIGGHLLDGCIIYTTAEIIIGETDTLVFTRERDNTTTWNELHIRNRKR